MPRYCPYNEKKHVALSPEREKVEYRAMCEILPQCQEIKDIYFAQGLYNPNHRVLRVETLSDFEGSSCAVTFALTSSLNYPNEQPRGVVEHPDISEIGSQGTNLRTYRDLDYRLICIVMTDWRPTSTLARYYLSCVRPWLYNFLTYLHTDGAWSPDLWLTGTEEGVA